MTEPLSISPAFFWVEKMISDFTLPSELLRRKSVPFLCLVFLSVGSLLGCNAHMYTPCQPGVSTRAERQSGSPILAYEKGPVPFENSILQQDPKMAYQVRYLKIPSI